MLLRGYRSTRAIATAILYNTCTFRCVACTRASIFRVLQRETEGILEEFPGVANSRGGARASQFLEARHNSTSISILKYEGNHRFRAATLTSSDKTSMRIASRHECATGVERAREE